MTIALFVIILAALAVTVAGFKNYQRGRGRVTEFYAVRDGELAWVTDAEHERVEL